MSAMARLDAQPTTASTSGISRVISSKAIPREAFTKITPPGRMKLGSSALAVARSLA